ncbi:MAG TPA: glucuronate isomerase [Rectinemataceae bacterium]|nr:glucuronate isomerase [Rectinemataceae bacterium]
MSTFLDDEFFLDTKTGRRLYTESAADMPIFDYHCHLSPEAIAEDAPFADLAEIWLGGDHYKWRIMRADGVPEELVSGRGDRGEKLIAYARSLQKAAGNPLLAWSHLELRRAYGIEELFTPENALRIRDRANAVMRERGDTPRRLMERFGVAVVCTTDDPVDDLAAHKKLAKDQTMATTILPTFRPDRIMAVSDSQAWRAYAERLGEASGVAIRRWADLAKALDLRHAYFHEAGCRISDHAVYVPEFSPVAESVLDDIVARLLSGKALDEAAQASFRTAVLIEGARLDAKRGWAMQLHVGALRNTRTRFYKHYGPDGGCDAISDAQFMAPLASLLDALDREGSLPRSILYSLDPAKNDSLVALAGSFCGSGGSGHTEPARVQVGAAWWFNDQKDGMTRHLESLASVGLVGRFLGMLTDSRSFLSYPRHEYFRRLLCGWVGRMVERGELPDDDAFTGAVVRAVSWGNAASWFGIDPPAWAIERASKVLPLI